MIQKPKADLSTMVIAPMPGVVKLVVAKEGDQARNSHICFRYTFCPLLISSAWYLIVQTTVHTMYL